MDYRTAARFYAALGSEVRLQILELISAHKEMCICELVDQLRLSQANISRHVSILRDAGIIHDRKVGTWVLLRVDEEALRSEFAALLDEIRRRHENSAQVDAAQRLAERSGRMLSA